CDCQSACAGWRPHVDTDLPRQSRPLSMQLRIDEVCSRFEEAWKSGQAPSLRSFFEEAEERDRQALLVELLRVEITYRSRKGESPSSADYLPVFPGYERAVSAAFMATGENGPGVSAPGRLPRVPGFRVQGPLGAGGMGVVYKAVQEQPSRVV